MVLISSFASSSLSLASSNDSVKRSTTPTIKAIPATAATAIPNGLEKKAIAASLIERASFLKDRLSTPLAEEYPIADKVPSMFSF